MRPNPNRTINGVTGGLLISRKDPNIPNPKNHKIVSFIKSGVRIVGYCYLPFDITIGVIILVISEIIGILEELT